MGSDANNAGWSNSFNLVAKECAQFFFTTEPDGHISGRVVDQHGALQAAEVRIWKPGSEFKFDEQKRSLVTNGIFDFGPLDPGSYILGAFVRNVSRKRTMYPRRVPISPLSPRGPEENDPLSRATLRFYPGTSDFKLAKPIEVGFGQHISGITLTIPFDPDKWRRGTLVRQ
jgi:hypothetical protein